jgi:hypothetical protein
MRGNYNVAYNKAFPNFVCCRSTTKFKCISYQSNFNEIDYVQLNTLAVSKLFSFQRVFVILYKGIAYFKWSRDQMCDGFIRYSMLLQLIK